MRFASLIAASALKFLAKKINDGPNNVVKRTAKETMKQVVSCFGVQSVAETIDVVGMIKGKNRPQVLDCFKNVECEKGSGVGYVKDVLLPLARTLDKESKVRMREYVLV